MQPNDPRIDRSTVLGCVLAQDTKALRQLAKAKPIAPEDLTHALAWVCDTGAGFAPFVPLLLSLGAQATSSALGVAIAQGHLPTIKKLLAAGAPPDGLPALNGPTPLLWAVQHGKQKVVQALLEAGANPNVISEPGDSALSGSQALERLSSQNAIQVSPLCYAIANLDLDRVHLLLKHDADPNLPDSDQDTPLHLLLFADQELTRGRPILRALIQAGGSIHASNGSGRSVLETAHAIAATDFERAAIEEAADCLQGQTLSAPSRPKSRL